MHITSLQIRNYKSYLESPLIIFSQGLNVIVGQNNAGKTALIEALSTRFENKPHRSLKTLPHPRPLTNTESSIEITFSVGCSELVELAADYFPEFFVPLDSSSSFQDQVNKLDNLFANGIEIRCVFGVSGQMSVLKKAYLLSHQVESTGCMRVSIDPNTEKFVVDGKSTFVCRDIGLTLPYKLANLFLSRLYAFSAERLNIGQSNIEDKGKILLPNAFNLPSVLLHFQQQNPKRFGRYVGSLRAIFPETEITVTVPIITQAQIGVSSISLDSERPDLSLPLSECGTGLGQVMAMLYVVVNSDTPQIIIIDEPQSFLHPGAVRKLFEIFRKYPRNQYIISTHSPTAIMASDPERIIHIKKVGSESTIEPVDINETAQMRSLLSELGARLSDVFGADNILWVEGRTEEQCFPMIVDRLIDKDKLLGGTVILGVVQTADLEGKLAEKVIDIYTQLCNGHGLLPPALGFILDRETYTDEAMGDLKKRSKGLIRFIGRRMYENYLLHPQAIASVMSSVSGFRDSVIQPGEIEKWIEDHRWDKKYLPHGTEETVDAWMKSVDAANLLKDMFNSLSETRVVYDKVTHGVALTKWLLDHEPEYLKEIAKMISSLLQDPLQSE